MTILLCGEQAHYDANIYYSSVAKFIIWQNGHAKLQGWNAATEFFSDIGPVVEGILSASQGLRRMKWTHILRLGNKAPALARLIGCIWGRISAWMEEVPSPVSPFVVADAASICWNYQQKKTSNSRMTIITRWIWARKWEFF